MDDKTTSDVQGVSLRTNGAEQATETGEETLPETMTDTSRSWRETVGNDMTTEPLAQELIIPELPRWTAADYASHITGSGAYKLADSGVAPLIAAARGYLRVDETNFVDQMKLMEIRMTTEQGRRMKRTLNKTGRDGMQMPWFSVADIQMASRDGKAAEPFTYQMRASNPEENKHGKVIKYEFVSEVGTPLDVHPATPVDWIDGTPVVMFAEGMLKGDSALSAYLHSNGVSYDDLKSSGVGDPAAKLRSLMDAIPEADRVLIISIAGIHNAKQNPVDWREVKLKDREGWIAFDADLAINPHVHAAAVDLHRRLDEKSKMSKVRILNPEVVTKDNGEKSKEGVDDYLAKTGTWKSLLKFLQDEMPAAPARNAEDRNGNWRISKDGLSAEECVARNGGPGGTIDKYDWETRLDMGARIVSLETRRQPTDGELRTGLFDTNVAAHDIEDAQVEIEIAWEEEGEVCRSTVTGPQTILHYSPADWDRRGATIPGELLRHPSWPPRAAKGESWLSAVKANRRKETTMKTRWMQMGWVPVAKGEPVFLIGDQVVGDQEVAGTAAAGIDERRLGVAPNYGVGSLLEGDFEDPEYLETVRQDFRSVMDTYIHSGAWTDPGTACLVLAGALRPAVPLRPRSTIFFWGPKGKGKSWTAKTMMYFWARRRSDWQDQLPGSAKDTFAYIENAVACTPIWVIDDLAPSAVKRQAESEDAKLADLTRAIFNNAAKGRMNADMTSRKVNKPIAQLIITAENELSTPSAKERLIPAYIGPGKLHSDSGPTDAINDLALDGVQARFTSHLIRYIRYTAVTRPGGWHGHMIGLEARRIKIQQAAEYVMREMGVPTGSLERATSLAADVLLTFDTLCEMAMFIDMEYEFEKQFEVAHLGRNIIQLVHETHSENQEAAPGRSLIRALTKLMASGGAHVISGDDPARAPVVGTDESESMSNHRLGWVSGNSDGTLRPSGPAIGTVITVKDRKVVIFDTDTAFWKAQEAYPSLIQHGQGTGAAWASVWDEGFAPEYLSGKTNRHKNRGSTVRVRFRNNRLSGVPVEVDTILSGGMTAAERMADDEEPGLAA